MMKGWGLLQMGTFFFWGGVLFRNWSYDKVVRVNREGLFCGEEL